MSDTNTTAAPSLREEIRGAYRRANQLAEASEMIAEISADVRVRTPFDRAKNPERGDPLGGVFGCDVKLPTMIIAEGLDKEHAEYLAANIRGYLKNLSQCLEHKARQELREVSRSPWAPPEKQESDGVQ